MNIDISTTDADTSPKASIAKQKNFGSSLLEYVVKKGEVRKCFEGGKLRANRLNSPYSFSKYQRRENDAAARRSLKL